MLCLLVVQRCIVGGLSRSAAPSGHTRVNKIIIYTNELSPIQTLVT